MASWTHATTMLKRLVALATSDPLSLPGYVLTKLLVFWLSRKHNVEINGKLVLNGFPIIDIRKAGHLYIGNGVTLNSKNVGYHINMHSPVKLFADRPGAQIRIGDHTRVHGTCIHAYQSIEIGSGCLIAANCQIMDCNGHDLVLSSGDCITQRYFSSRSVAWLEYGWV
jgi:acetyltransferase-like isoleucine patch superfamily enzyme